MRLIGLDIGTTSCKVAMFDEKGRLHFSAQRQYEVLIPYPKWAEQNAEGIWHLVQDALREIIAKHTEDPTCDEEIAAIGLSVQGEAVLPVDRAGIALCHAILGMDTRTGVQNDLLRQNIGAREIFEHTGMPLHTINTLPKLMWLKQHEPEVWRTADKFLLYEDFFIQKMTGSTAISHCLASRTQLYDTRAKTWSESILAFLELKSGRLAQIYPSGTPVGRMLPDLAAELGFSTPPIIVTGGHDQACGALGVGLTQAGQAMVSTGSAEVVEVVSETPFINTSLYQGNMSVYTHTVPQRYLTMTVNHSGGLLLRWFRDTLGQLESQHAHEKGLDAYDVILQQATAEPSGLLLLPHFAGSGTPAFDTASKGAVLGLTLSTSKADLAKAVIEGLTYELQLNIEVLKQGGVKIDELRAIGGGAKSKLWLQLKADITGIPVVVPRITDAACWGAALLAGAGAGCFGSISAASEDSVVLTDTYQPNPERQQKYAELFATYKMLYPAIKEILHRL